MTVKELKEVLGNVSDDLAVRIHVEVLNDSRHCIDIESISLDGIDKRKSTELIVNVSPVNLKEERLAHV